MQVATKIYPEAIYPEALPPPPGVTPAGDGGSVTPEALGSRPASVRRARVPLHASANNPKTLEVRVGPPFDPPDVPCYRPVRGHSRRSVAETDLTGTG